MKLLSLLMITFAALSAAHAEVLPKIPGGGFIMNEACGLINRSYNICLARANQSGRHYVVISHFLGKGNTYIPVTIDPTKPVTIGANQTTYRGVYMSVDSTHNAPTENHITLVTSQVIYPGAPMTATYTVNGVQHSQKITLKAVPQRP